MANLTIGKTNIAKKSTLRLFASPRLRKAVGYAAHYAVRLGLNRSEGIWAPAGSEFLEPKGIPTVISEKMVQILKTDTFAGLPESILDAEKIRGTVAAFTSRTLSRRISTRNIEDFGARLGLKGQDIATLRRLIEKDRSITAPTLVEKSIECARILGQLLLAKGEKLEEVDPVNAFQVLNEPLQDARKLKSINEVRRIEAIDRDTGEPIKGVEIYRVFRSDMPEAMQKVYGRLGIQYVFYAVDRRSPEEGGTGLRYSYAVAGPVGNPVIGKEATLGGGRSRDYSKGIGAPKKIEQLHQVWKQIYDNIWLGYGMLIKSAGAGADVRGDEASWRYGITLGGGKSVEHQPDAWKVEHITTEQTKDPAKLKLIANRDARDLQKGNVIETLSRWEFALLTAEDMDNPADPRMMTMAQKTDYLVGDPRVHFKGGYPTNFTAAVVFNGIKALIEAGKWEGLSSLKDAAVFVEGYGGVASYLVDHFIESGVKKIVIVERDNQTTYDVFEKHQGYAGKKFDGRTKTQYVQQVLIPEAAKKGVEIVLEEPPINEQEIAGMSTGEILNLRAERLANVRLAILEGKIHPDVNVYSPNAGGDVIKEAEAKAIVNRKLWVAGATNNAITSLKVEEMVGMQVVPSSLINDGGVMIASEYVNGDNTETMQAKKTEICPAKVVKVFELAKEWGINYSEAFRRVTDILINRKKVKDRINRYKE